MTAFCMCKPCKAGDHCHGTSDRPLSPEAIAAHVCGGYHCSCECAMQARAGSSGTVHSHPILKSLWMEETHAGVVSEQPHFHRKGSSWQDHGPAEQVKEG